MVIISRHFLPHFFFCNWILHIWNGFYTWSQSNTKTKDKMSFNSITDMKFVKNFTPSDFQAKNFTPSISPNFNSFSDKNTKKLVKMEKFTPLAKILHCRRQWRHGQISPLAGTLNLSNHRLMGFLKLATRPASLTWYLVLGSAEKVQI